jgi:hypothetical protein
MAATTTLNLFAAVPVFAGMVMWELNEPFEQSDLLLPLVEPVTETEQVLAFVTVKATGTDPPATPTDGGVTPERVITGAIFFEAAPAGTAASDAAASAPTSAAMGPKCIEDPRTLSPHSGSTTGN